MGTANKEKAYEYASVRHLGGRYHGRNVRVNRKAELFHERAPATADLLALPTRTAVSVKKNEMTIPAIRPASGT